MSICLRRREFIPGLGGAVAWPLAARAQQGNRVRRIGVLMGGDENDPEVQLRYSAFTQALAALGWTDGRNVRMDLRWSGGDSNRIRALAQELVGLQPDIILAKGDRGERCPSAGDADDPNRLASVADPVASGIVERLICPHLRRRPGHSRSCQSLDRASHCARPFRCYPFGRAQGTNGVPPEESHARHQAAGVHHASRRPAPSDDANVNLPRTRLASRDQSKRFRLPQTKGNGKTLQHKLTCDWDGVPYYNVQV
jgi:hypothetical protein